MCGTADAATLTTKPFVFSGARLLLNLDAGGGGSLFIEAHLGSASGPPVLTSSFLTHNGVDLEVAFRPSANASETANATAIASLAGQPVGPSVSLSLSLAVSVSLSLSLALSRAHSLSVCVCMCVSYLFNSYSPE